MKNYLLPSAFLAALLISPSFSYGMDGDRMDIDGEDQKPTTVPALLVSAPPPPQLIPIPQILLAQARNNPITPPGYASPNPIPVPPPPASQTTRKH